MNEHEAPYCDDEDDGAYCDECSSEKAFKTLKEVDDHMLKVHYIKNNRCNRCDQELESANMLEQHKTKCYNTVECLIQSAFQHT